MKYEEYIYLSSNKKENVLQKEIRQLESQGKRLLKAMGLNFQFKINVDAREINRERVYNYLLDMLKSISPVLKISKEGMIELSVNEENFYGVVHIYTMRAVSTSFAEVLLKKVTMQTQIVTVSSAQAEKDFISLEFIPNKYSRRKVVNKTKKKRFEGLEV
jgi:hypothetical protein